MIMRNVILTGDVREKLGYIPDETVQCVVTSPPYWGLRDYGTPGQLGLEATPEKYVANMVAVFREIKRVLRKDGTVWLNLGDSYTSGGMTGRNDTDRPTPGGRGGSFRGGKRSPIALETGLKPKDLVGIPWRVAFALQADGWYLRSDIIWSKPNPMPESVTDRPTKAHEYVFLLSKSERYLYDADAIREPQSEGTFRRYKEGEQIPSFNKMGGSDRKNESFAAATPLAILPNGRNARTVWEIATQPYSAAHFATYPEELAKRCILAGTREGDLVLDPFLGSGTTALVAKNAGRDYIGIELNAEYVKLAEKRIRTEQERLL